MSAQKAFMDLLIAAMLDAATEGHNTQLKTSIDPDDGKGIRFVRIIVIPEEMPQLSAREAVILTYMRSVGRAVTDRQIQAGLGFPEPGCVRPRVCSLIDKGIVKEVGTQLCGITGKNVRICGVVE